LSPSPSLSLSLSVSLSHSLNSNSVPFQSCFIDYLYHSFIVFFSLSLVHPPTSFFHTAVVALSLPPLHLQSLSLLSTYRLSLSLPHLCTLCLQSLSLSLSLLSLISVSNLSVSKPFAAPS